MSDKDKIDHLQGGREMSELKPCHSCGGKAEKKELKYPIYSTRYGEKGTDVATCANSDCFMSGFLIGIGDWNTRADSWVSANNPPDDDHCRVQIMCKSDPDMAHQGYYDLEDGGWFYDNDLPAGDDVTCWQPLPTPPKQEKIK